MAAMFRAAVSLSVVLALVACQREEKGISEDLPAARSARALADAQAIASAARQYQATFQALPDSIEDLIQSRTVAGVTGGPFLALTSPYFVLGRPQPSPYTHVRLGLRPPSGLVWLAIWPGTLRGHARCGNYSLEAH